MIYFLIFSTKYGEKNVGHNMAIVGEPYNAMSTLIPIILVYS